MPSGNPAQSGDEIPIARGGTSYKITAGSIADLAGGVEGPVSSVNNQIALFAGTSGDSIQAASTTGLLKASSGVIAAAVLGVDYGDVSSADTISTDNAIVRFDGTSGKLIQKSTAGVTDAGYLTANGLTFPATPVLSADPNTLDDYEEGNWTPTYFSNGLSGVTYSTLRRGRYVKLGKVVFIWLYIATTGLTVTGSSDDVAIAGLPFAPENVYDGPGVITISRSFSFVTNAPSYCYPSTLFTGAELMLEYKTAPNATTVSSFLSGNMDTASGKNVMWIEGFYVTTV